MESLNEFRPRLRRLLRYHKQANQISDTYEREPEYNPDALARIFFGNIYFYQDLTPKKRRQRANRYESIRNQLFQDKTVKDILEPLESVDAVHKTFGTSGVNSLKVIALWKTARKQRTPEVVLHGKILVVSGINEVMIIDEYYVELPTSFRDVKKTIPADERAQNIRFVMGPSGSGKTFCAVNVAAVEGLKESDEKYVTVYFNIAVHSVTNLMESCYIVEKVQKVLQDKCAMENVNYNDNQMLDLTLSVVLDESGSLYVKPRFETLHHIHELYNEIGKLATKIRLVMCGTGLAASEFVDGIDAIKYRMKPWSTDDLRTVNKERFFLSEEAFNAVQKHSGLNAMSTNARSAHFLLKRICTFFDKAGNDRYYDVVKELCNCAPGVVRGAVTDYISCNSILNLDDKQRHRVAAFVFHVIEYKGRKCEAFVLQEIKGLSLTEQDVVLALISINMETDSNGKSTIVHGEHRPISVSPALTIVLYWMCGVPIPMLFSLERQDSLSALYEMRQRMRSCVCDYQNSKISDEQFSNNLVSLKLIEFRHRVAESIPIPLLDNWTVWVNKGIMPYADVVAPYSLYLSQSSDGGSSSINLVEELGKCGLVKDSVLLTDDDERNQNDIGWAITKSLEYMWLLNITGDQPDNFVTSKSKVSHPIDGDSESRYFYPDKHTIGPSSAMDYRYATLDFTDSKWFLNFPKGSKNKPVNISRIQKLSDDFIVYICCNQDHIILMRSRETGQEQSTCQLTISEYYLDDSGNIIESRLSNEHQKEWNYYQTLLREKVKIRFLL